MKRLLAAAALAALFLVPSVAQAAKFSNPTPVKWRLTNLFVSTSSPHDTTVTTVKVGTTDTTNAVSTEGWIYPDAAVADSVVLATLWLEADSTTAIAGNFTATSLTITPQYSASGMDASWTSGAAITFTDITSGDLVAKLPIYYVGNVTRGLLNAAGWPAPRMRWLITAIGGVISPARLYLTVLLPNGSS